MSKKPKSPEEMQRLSAHDGWARWLIVRLGNGELRTIRCTDFDPAAMTAWPEIKPGEWVRPAEGLDDLWAALRATGSA